MTYDKLVEESVKQRLNEEFRVKNGYVEVKNNDEWSELCHVEDYNDLSDDVRFDDKWKVVYSDDVGYKLNGLDDYLYVPLNDPFNPVYILKIFDENQEFVADELKSQVQDIHKFIRDNEFYVDELGNPDHLYVKKDKSVVGRVKNISKKDLTYITLSIIISFISSVLNPYFILWFVVCLLLVGWYISNKITGFNYEKYSIN